jgi:hypothetical protein
MNDSEWMNARADAARGEEERLLAAAKAEAARAGKEPFDYAKLCTMYDPTNDLATKIYDPAETARALENRYYVDYPGVLTLAEFAERMNEMRAWG